MDNAADVHDDLVLRADSGNCGGGAWAAVFGQVDPWVDHGDPVGRHALLGDDHVLDRLT